MFSVPFDSFSNCCDIRRPFGRNNLQHTRGLKEISLKTRATVNVLIRQIEVVN